jgi:hypothetical protein
MGIGNWAGKGTGLGIGLGMGSGIVSLIGYSLSMVSNHGLWVLVVAEIPNTDELLIGSDMVLDHMY